MCGLAGFLGGDIATQEEGIEIARRMAGELLHRGPDDGGAWCDASARIGLGHRRLSILDLSPAGHQPMLSAGGRFVIAFNGEIYNHLDLRQALGADMAWRGHSDTETLLACIEAWGLEETLCKSVGMFAVALWDREQRALTLARDRFGEKPLYYGWQGAGARRVFLFASELKALKAHSAFAATVDRGALSLLLRHNYIPAPHSIYSNIAKLLPGSLLTISLAQSEPAIRMYWDVKGIARECRRAQFKGTPDDAVDGLESLARQAVRAQMLADVPLGA